MKRKSDRKSILTMISVAFMVFVGLYCTAALLKLPPTFDGEGMDVVALMEDPTGYPDLDANGVATVIVKDNLETTVSDNVVGSIVYNFRGYDTMGESIVLITSVIGTAAILRNSRKKKEEGGLSDGKRG